ncbi:hemerythrin domain-containing protein [Actinomadura rudentiformis]|uniref:Hemerythrin domain-containing protein n=1 Tax=Actinomadura rudentiformis TaxID=359158 RepID=A0A6H9YT14_9ACTN|nr:hemerythrin domain-containing protein [Actinomadura rudentiformis]KAB2344322.1 hemerythrin domain-containing protein [Actinomadura rudentiformis]
MPTAPAKTDVVDLLIQQHSQIRELFDEVAESRDEARHDAFGRLVRLLAVHETAEEEIVHPAARTSLPGGSGIVDDRLNEEHEAKEQLAALEDMGPDDPRFDAELDVLRVAVLTHARAEERYEFFRIRDQFTEKQLTALGAAVKAAEATAPTHPHPGTESATKNLLAGPLVAMVDRIRDIIRKAH